MLYFTVLIVLYCTLLYFCVCRCSFGQCCTQGVTLALHVWALTAHAQEVLPAQDGFLWTHGTYQFHTLTTEHGEVPPLEGWARMWTHASENEVCFFVLFVAPGPGFALHGGTLRVLLVAPTRARGILSLKSSSRSPRFDQQERMSQVS